MGNQEKTCIWKFDKSEGYLSGCGHVFDCLSPLDKPDDYDYCPYCGERIDSDGEKH